MGWAWKQLGKHVCSAAMELGEVNTDVFALHGDKPILLLPPTFPVKHKGIESWLEYSLCLNVSPFPSGTKSTPVPDTIFPSIREIFKDPLNWKSSGSRRGHRHFLRGSLTQRGNSCPLIGLLIISAVLCCCEIILYLLQICPHIPWGHTITEINLYWWGVPRKWNCGNSMHIYWVHTDAFGEQTVLFCFAFLRQAPAWKAYLWLRRFAGPNTIFSLGAVGSWVSQGSSSESWQK